ncbi:EscJ/YscJ/HrcJ family type III secretion inner membrane ring protein [Mesorhizobium sp. M1A.F.Ca.IN.020.06.1.1]|uniref:type III secretion system inner membrane ring lipoprotein SctJ n=1 Tax=unclassified Mesorhizobium TaxID=325217 RepID=UPI000FCB373D|nr:MULTISPECIES: type III secretion inner membrane ring lipoprotein SctJ [unclassified Mesorhizobium]RUV82734.1 EscJ/YscJ/HrcJ family type III secretion inner membrane ring protein [Mesorhizobium sp. M1A.F.Ca.IN.020.32.1.1]RUW07242.1 EscJ/YscJ/HrcJ family type III secretion inner membrane ring protein [Mesorhizobium sp. M1A.F.Ca.IN.022.05.2.1]RUW31752.1 EscJ/YscJ/HrcJ family type III secretion inner membrane ring protein [Mesorhizobium sp. M1A.F.Ca.IN.020.06.1.1]RWF76729.1 MAG: EscJ/YscJ/HrcJ f
MGLTSVLKRLATPLLLFTLTGCGSKLELYRNLPAHEANEMLALLMSQGIHAEKTTDNSGTASLSVDTKDVPPAMDVLNGAGLPHDLFADMGSLFKKEGMISSPTEERVRYIYGATQELSRTLSTIDGVLSARVHAVLPQETSDDRNPSFPSSAAVLVRYAPGAAVDQFVPKIKELVANSLEGLSYERVSVVLVEASQDHALLHSVDRTAVLTTEDSGARHLVVGLVGGIAVLLIGNGVLAFLLWRRFREASAIAAQRDQPNGTIPQ